MTAHFHYEEEVNLTFHLQCVMGVIRKRGPEIKGTLRNCPRRARKPSAEEAITRNGSCAAANEGVLKEYLHRLLQIDRTVTPVRMLARTPLPKI